MKDKLEPNMYVRTKRGTFDRFMTSKKIESLTWYTFEDRGSITNPENYIIKASYNIIDILEVGDYVNGNPVCIIKEDEHNRKWIYTDSNYKYGYLEEDIKSILTHEQFEQMAYKVVE